MSEKLTNTVKQCIIDQFIPIGVKYYPIRYFCVQCGAGFPPREGEGICRDWKVCELKQREEENKGRPT